MNFNIARELMNERTRDMLAEARQARRSRDLHRARRQQRTRTTESAQVPAIPDYVHQLVGDNHADLSKAS